MEPAGLDASIETAEHVCQEVRSLLANVHSMLERVRDVSAPESMSTTMAGILKALAEGRWRRPTGCRGAPIGNHWL
jgi:hypothetical protein